MVDFLPKAIYAIIPVSKIDEAITPMGIVCFTFCRIEVIPIVSVPIKAPLNVVLRLIILLEWLFSAATVA